MSSDTDKNLDYEGGTANVVDMHDSVRREKVLESEGHESLGVIALIIGAVLLLLGGGHLFSYASSNTFADHTPAPRPAADGAGAGEEDIAWIDKWMKDGKKVYGSCVACHMPTGTGQPGMFPPLVGSEWVDGGTERLGAIMMRGIQGPFTVAGQTYNQAMPAWNTLPDDKIAQVVTYIRREFGTMPEGDDGVVTVEMIQAAREKYAGGAAFDEAALLAIPADANLPGSKVDLETGNPVQ